MTQLFVKATNKNHNIILLHFTYIIAIINNNNNES